jgi:transcription-repair coupling factor (superfamily II helicase)
MILPIVSELLEVIGRHPAVEGAADELLRGAPEAQIFGLADPAKALVAARVAAELKRPVILLTSSNERSETLGAAVNYFFRALGGTRAPGPEAIQVLPALDVTPWEGRSPHPEIAEKRAAALWRAASGQVEILVAPVGAALLRAAPARAYQELARTVIQDEELPMEELVAFLRTAGYQREQTVSMPGQFAVRGGILDVFSPEASNPVRLELLGDVVESLREFHPETQRSVRPVERVTLVALSEILQRQQVLARTFRSAGVSPAFAEADAATDSGLTGTFPGWEFHVWGEERIEGNLLQLLEKPVVVLDEPADIVEAGRALRERWQEAYEDREAGSPEAGLDAFLLAEEEWTAALEAAPRLLVERLALGMPGTSRAERNAVGTKNTESAERTVLCQPTARYHGNLPAFLNEARGRLRAGEQILVSSATVGETERLAEILRDAELPYRIGETSESPGTTFAGDEIPGAGSAFLPAVTLLRTPLAEGVVLPELRLALYGNGDIFDTLAVEERARQRAVPRPRAAAFVSDFADLKPGDFVVHVDHGIGRFEGLRRIGAADGSARDGEFMHLTYADEARLYVPLERMDLVQRYNALGGAAPALDRLGGTAWAARNARVRKSVAEMADKLLLLYAQRRIAKGIAFSRDTPWQHEFEDAFEFEETPDQMRAIEEMKRDMENAEPMDRLLCGDVGYGKTEVAMRAAFKAVADGRQAAVLAPTTVLAFQHWETFRRRMAAFPLRVELLSRFRTRAEQKRVLADLEAGKVDVVIGTHRLLSKDVHFPNLGLLIVDEEQRFGVAHKERIKELRKEVDILTLSATPIPRTLHMALAGLRNMSLIETPPKDRLAIQTVVAPFSEALISRAIGEELDRGGQVFFVHNRVGSIHSVAALIKRLVPRARILVGHGQMNERELERVMLAFVRREADVLVATTIIENGLDIPNCNTLIVNRADRMGLSELYQLRGRVGRSSVRAYAYLLVPPDAPLSGEARQRLAALREFSELGAGFRIAALDLEMRGAGNLLGREQHGHIGAVGFEMYCHMLERAVAEQKGETLPPERRTTIQLGLDIRIPETYIEEEALRLRAYKRIAAVATEEQSEEMQRELADRFGPPPAPVMNLLGYATLKALAEQLQVEAIERRGSRVAIRFAEQASLPPEPLVRLVRSRRDLKIEPGGVLWMETRQEGTELTEAVKSVLRALGSSR